MFLLQWKKSIKSFCGGGIVLNQTRLGLLINNTEEGKLRHHENADKH